MSALDNKAIIRRFNDLVQEYWQTGDVNLFDEVLAPDFVHHSPGLPPDRAGMKQAIPMFRNAFPDMRLTVDDVLAEGDKVIDRVTVHCTHRGDFMGVPATGKVVTVSEIHISRVAGGKIVERWGQWDALGMLQQIGAVSAPEQATS